MLAPALAWPLAYLVWTLVHGAISDWYPYRFIDAGDLGYARMLRNAAGVVVLGLVLLGVFVTVDRRRSRAG